VSPWQAGVTLKRNGGRGSHSSTFRLDVSAFCGIGCTCRGYLGVLQAMLVHIAGCLGCNKGCNKGVMKQVLGGVRKDLSETAQIELKSGRVYCTPLSGALATG